jgi:KDO2-lipid IV(A) lauroyltransferase
MFFIRLLSRLPLSAFYVISDFLFLITYYVVGYRRKLVRKNLKNAFPEKDKKSLRKIERDFYRNLCDYGVEMLKTVTMSREEMMRRMVFRNPEVVEQFKNAGQSIIFFASHQFNWEWLLISASASHPMPIDFVYQPVNNKFFDKLMLHVRTRFGGYPIRRDEVARELVKRKNILRIIATVSDQYPGYGRDKKYSTTFLNQETVFFMGANSLAYLSQYPAMYYKCRKIRRGYYESTPVIIALPPYPKDSLKVIEGYVRVVEEVIREYPQGWLWSHNRWKKRHLQQASQTQTP